MRDHSNSTIIRDIVVDAQRDTVVLGSSISSSVTGAASPSVTVTGKKNFVLNTVSYIFAERQGPPR